MKSFKHLMLISLFVVGVASYSLLAGTAKAAEPTFAADILPLFNQPGAWFDRNAGLAFFTGTWDDDNDFTFWACDWCHAGDIGSDGAEDFQWEKHLMNLGSYDGMMIGADVGYDPSPPSNPCGLPLFGQTACGDTDYDWAESKLRKRLRNNRMPPQMPFNIDEGNREGGDVVLAGAADGDDILLGGQFAIKTTAGEVEYDGLATNAQGLLETYVANLDGAGLTYAGSASPVAWADVAGLFSKANVWYNGGLACTYCHYCDTEPPCFHMMELTKEGTSDGLGGGILAGGDGGAEPLLGEAVVGNGGPYDWASSNLRARLHNNRMPPNAPFVLDESNRDGRTISVGPYVAAIPVKAVDLIGDWIDGPDNIEGTPDDAPNN